MPFHSAEQRAYLWRNEPEIARRWAKKYGSRIVAKAAKRKKKYGLNK